MMDKLVAEYMIIYGVAKREAKEEIEAVCIMEELVRENGSIKLNHPQKKLQ